MLWDPFLYCINDSIQGNSETGNKVFVLPSKVAINNLNSAFHSKTPQNFNPARFLSVVNLHFLISPRRYFLSKHIKSSLKSIILPRDFFYTTDA